jgi:hypothetical protein
MLISGPNHGRNSSAAFALSSGTIGAAMAGALAVPIAGPSGQKRSFMPSIALSYGVVERPVPPRALELAHEVAVGVCKRLFDDWGWEDEAKRNPVQVYSVNVPLVTEAIERANRKVCFTTMWRNTYGQLFVPTQKAPQEETNWSAADKVNQPDDAENLQDVDGPLRFRFAPNFHPHSHLVPFRHPIPFLFSSPLHNLILTLLSTLATLSHNASSPNPRQAPSRPPHQRRRATLRPLAQHLPVRETAHQGPRVGGARGHSRRATVLGWQGLRHKPDHLSCLLLPA